jgi:cell division septum initiation protein DivIVA
MDEQHTRTPDDVVVEMPTDEHTGLGASLSNVADSVRSIVEAAEKAAAAVLDDAKKQARRTVEEANSSVEAMWRERSERIDQLSQSVARHGQELQARIDQLQQQTNSLREDIEKAIQGSHAEFRPSPPAPSHVAALDEPGAMPTEVPHRSRFRREREAPDKPWTKPR